MVCIILKKSVFEKLFLNALETNNTAKNEYYVAPLYNQLIEQGGIVFYDLIDSDKILFCGTPSEYRSLMNKGK